MAQPNCQRCNNPFFELGTISPAGSRFKFHTVHCSACGAVVAVTSFSNEDAFMDDMQNKLVGLEGKIVSILKGVQFLLKNK